MELAGIVAKTVRKRISPVAADAAAGFGVGARRPIRRWLTALTECGRRTWGGLLPWRVEGEEVS